MDVKTAERLSAMRREHGYTQEELAERLGVSRQAVSKWERAEASPDTDNLIALANLYGVSLDELLNMKKVSGDAAQDTAAEKKTASSADTGSDGIQISEGEQEIYIGGSGIRVSDGEREVHIGGDGVTVKRDKATADNGRPADARQRTAGNARLADVFLALPYPILITIAFLLWGFLANGWYVSWTLFLTVPVYYSFIDCIKKRSLNAFCFPCAVTFVYLLLGMLYGWWHPHWVMFLTVPVYYCIADPITKMMQAPQHTAGAAAEGSNDESD